MRGTRFTETMLGTVRLDGEPGHRRIRLDLRAVADQVLLPHRTTPARLTGRVRIAGHTDDPRAEGELEVSPIARRRIRYRLTFTSDGRRLTLDGWKSVTPRRPLTSMTVLPFTVHEGPARVGEGVLRFPLATGLLPFLLGFRFPRREDPAEHTAPRWNGTPGRTEVWYTTLTDPATGTGVWLHHELTAPADGSEPFAHGWAAVFPARARCGTPASDPSPGPGRPTDSRPRTSPAAADNSPAARATSTGDSSNNPREHHCSPSPDGPGAALCCPRPRCCRPPAPRTRANSRTGKRP